MFFLFFNSVIALNELTYEIKKITNNSYNGQESGFIILNFDLFY